MHVYAAGRSQAVLHWAQALLLEQVREVHGRELEGEQSHEQALIGLHLQRARRHDEEALREVKRHAEHQRQEEVRHQFKKAGGRLVRRRRRRLQTFSDVIGACSLQCASKRF